MQEDFLKTPTMHLPVACTFLPHFGAFNRGHVEWPAFEWMHMDCFPDLIQLACLLPQKEDNLRTQTTKVYKSLIFNSGNS